MDGKGQVCLRSSNIQDSGLSEYLASNNNLMTSVDSLQLKKTNLHVFTKIRKFTFLMYLVIVIHYPRTCEIYQGQRITLSQLWLHLALLESIQKSQNKQGRNEIKLTQYRTTKTAQARISDNSGRKKLIITRDSNFKTFYNLL